MQKYSILSPHIDDEVIGCYRLLAAGQIESVCYFQELTEERVKEGKACAKRFGFRANFFTASMPLHEVLKVLADLYLNHTIIVPHIADQHPHHKQVNKGANGLKGVQLKFYSVDMNVECDVLDEETRKAKRNALYELFPSQQPLFNQDSKYFLFESLLDTDWVKMLVKDSHFTGSERSMWVRPDDD
jgi:hypothetical protein